MPNGNFEESADIILSQQGLPQSEKTKSVPFWPILLLCSTILNVILAMLLTQQNLRIENTSSDLNEATASAQNSNLSNEILDTSVENTESFTKEPNSMWKPGESLPGASSKVLEISDSSSNQSNLNEYESTKLLVQQVFSSYSNSEETGKAIIDAPVRFNSTDMLWSEEQIQGAREILGALRQHQKNVTSLKIEAQELSDAWNDLIRSSRPFSLLRADSPSLNK